MVEVDSMIRSFVSVVLLLEVTLYSLYYRPYRYYLSYV